MENDPIVIVSAKRTPTGAFQGIFKNTATTDLGAMAIKATLDHTKIDPTHVDEVIMGCVLQAGLGQAPARQATLKAGLPKSVYCSTINKVCGSGMRSVMYACDQIALGHSQIVIAGGMENMTMGPYLLMKGRSGYRFGHDVILDHTLLDGLEDPYQKKAMGVYAENTVDRYGFTREEQDSFAIESGRKAIEATEKGWFKDEIAKITLKERGKEVEIEKDEQLDKLDFSRVPTLKPAFREGGTVTAASSSPITDGASALMLMKASKAQEMGLQPLAKVVGYTSHSHEPEWFTTAPIGAIQKLYKKTGWQDKDVDLYEINEAFAVVTMAATKELQLDPTKVNVHGGACALGHPIGSSGSRILVTLVHALARTGGKRGIAAICIGGGESVATAIELL